MTVHSLSIGEIITVNPEQNFLAFNEGKVSAHSLTQSKDEVSPQLKHEPESAVSHNAAATTLGSSLIPQMIGPYQIIRELGRATVGDIVYLAEDTVNKRNVEIRVLHINSQNAELIQYAEQMQSRFVQNVREEMQWNHQNLRQFYGVDLIDSKYVLAMEYIDGVTLSEFTMASNLLTERQVVSLIRKLAMAFDVLHQKGFAHRDIKPGNIILHKSDAGGISVEPKVVNFDLTISMDSQALGDTRYNMVVGTPSYMSKEQWCNRGSLGPASDVYSLGLVLYELLTGKLPYDVEDDEPATTWFVWLMTLPQIPPSSRIPKVDAKLDTIVMRAIAKEPHDRFVSMAEFAGALDRWQSEKPSAGFEHDSKSMVGDSANRQTSSNSATAEFARWLVKFIPTRLRIRTSKSE